MFTLFQVIWLCYLIPYVIPRYSNKLLDFFDWYPVYIPMSILIYGWASKVTLYRRLKMKIARSRKSPPLDKQLSEGLVDRLKKVMEEEKLWMDPYT